MTRSPEVRSEDFLGFPMPTNVGVCRLKAAVLMAHKQLVLEQVPEPILADDDVMVVPVAVGICGSDLSVYRGTLRAKLPVILGHEFCGIVAEVGGNVTRCKPGDYVVCEPSWNCGKCYWCNNGLPGLCDGLCALGRSVDGAFAERVRVPTAIVHQIPASVTPVDAQAIPVIANVLHAFKRGDMKPGASVAVIGPGFSGLVSIRLAKALGARRVDVIGTRQARLETAVAWGAEGVFRTDDPDLIRQVQEAVDGIGPDVVIEASGSSEGLRQAISIVRKGGTVISYGVQVDNVDRFDASALYAKELTIIGSKGGYGNYTEAIELLAMGCLGLGGRRYYREFPLSETPRAFDILDRRLEDVVRGVVLVSERP